jgi:hypothetical protein
VALGGDAGGAATIQSNKGRFSTGSGSAYNGYINARLGSMSSLTDCDVYVEWTPNANAATESYLGIILRGSNDWPSWNRPTSGYQVNIENGGSKLVLITSGSPTDLTAFSSDSWTSGQTWALRFQCIGTTIRFRVWNTSGGEPGTWKGSVTNSSVTSGRFQMWLENGSGGTDCYHDFDNLVVTDTLSGLPVYMMNAGVRFSPHYAGRL